MDRPDKLERCFQRGMQARLDKLKLAENPYDIETDEHREWAAGWRASPDLDEDDDPQSSRIQLGEADDDAAKTT